MSQFFEVLIVFMGERLIGEFLKYPVDFIKVHPVAVMNDGQKYHTSFEFEKQEVSQYEQKRHGGADATMIRLFGLFVSLFLYLWKMR